MDYLNLQLADYELCTEAFVAFRARQLQVTRAQLLDHAPFSPLAYSPVREVEHVGTSAMLDDLNLVSWGDFPVER